MNAVLHNPTPKIVSGTDLKEKGYMTLEQSKTIISKKIEDACHSFLYHN